jgi:hypothetical protein
MLAKHDVALRIATLLLPVLLCAAPAAAEGTSESTGSIKAAESPATAPKVPRAPIGHRQPTLADIPKDIPKHASDEEHERRERELDAKLQICRGC